MALLCFFLKTFLCFEIDLSFLILFFLALLPKLHPYFLNKVLIKKIAPINNPITLITIINGNHQVLAIFLNPLSLGFLLSGLTISSSSLGLGFGFHSGSLEGLYALLMRLII